jgi:nitroreductase
MAICPTKSIHIEGLDYEKDFFDLSKDRMDGAAFVNLLASRRSVRVFQDRPVPREILERIIEIIAMAPLSYPPHKVEVTVVQNRDTIEKGLPHMVEAYENLLGWFAKPISRFFMRRKIKPETVTSLTEHLLPSLPFRVRDMKAGRDDTITRNAPAMLLFHAHRESGSHTEDIFIALTYGLLAAHALGLGATAIGMVPPVAERVPELRALFQIPPDNEVLASMIVGYPKYRFKRGIRRQLAAVTWI